MKRGGFGRDGKSVEEGQKRFDAWVDALCERAPVRGWTLRILTRLSRGPVARKPNISLQGLTRFSARQVSQRAPGLFRLIASNPMLRKMYREATTKPPTVAVAPLVHVIEMVQISQKIRDPMLASLLLTEMTSWTPGKRIDV